MPIKVVCQCGQKFTAKDEMAGKRVKCPKCGQPLTIGAPQQTQPQPPAQPQQPTAQPQQFPAQPQQPPTPAMPAMSGGLGDLLDEIGTPSQSSGPQCPACGAEMEPGAVICVECGFNIQTGERIQSAVQATQQQAELSEAEKLIQRAEAEIAASPMQSAKYDYGGEGLKTYLVAFGLVVGVAIAILFIGAFVVYATTVVFKQDSDGNVDSGRITTFMIQVSAGVTLLYFWVDVIGLGFAEKPIHGLLCMCTCIYTPVYSVLRAQKLPRAMFEFLIAHNLMSVTSFIEMNKGEDNPGSITFLVLALICWDVWVFFISWLTSGAYEDEELGHAIPSVISTCFAILLGSCLILGGWLIMPGLVLLIYPFVYGFMNFKKYPVATIGGLIGALSFVVFGILFVFSVG